jgi:hypothetical protein
MIMLEEELYESKTTQLELLDYIKMLESESASWSAKIEYL